ncbi:hypothetical protein ASF90_12995 [Xanthomonas sp. Leaf148]|nr:hypothetical protein ASF90_12995 [Xanthomonas sp. Leaf148]
MAISLLRGVIRPQVFPGGKDRLAPLPDRATRVDHGMVTTAVGQQVPPQHEASDERLDAAVQGSKMGCATTGRLLQNDKQCALALAAGMLHAAIEVVVISISTSIAGHLPGFKMSRPNPKHRLKPAFDIAQQWVGNPCIARQHQ